MLEDIQSGRFTRDWMLENKVHQASFKATRRRNAEHNIEEVGANLRAMMPWIGANRLVDTDKNYLGREGLNFYYHEEAFLKPLLYFTGYFVQSFLI